MSDIEIGGRTYCKRDGVWILDYEPDTYAHVPYVEAAMLDEIERLRAENSRALRIGRAVLACSQGTVDERVYMPGKHWTSRPDVLLRHLLAAGEDPDE